MFVVLVQTRHFDEDYFLDPINYDDLVSILKTRKFIPVKNTENEQIEQFNPTDNQTNSHRGRIFFSNFGRKSHWDTFFGRK